MSKSYFVRRKKQKLQAKVRNFMRNFSEYGMDASDGIQLFENFSQYGDNRGGNLIQVTFENTFAGPVPVTFGAGTPIDPKIKVSTTGGGGYGQLQLSMLSKPFEVKNIKVFTQSRSQLNMPISIGYSNERGRKGSITVVPSALKSMYQNVPNQIDSLGEKVYLDVDSTIDFTILANETVTIIFETGKQVDPVKDMDNAFKGKANTGYKNMVQPEDNSLLGTLYGNVVNPSSISPGPGNWRYQGVRFVN